MCPWSAIARQGISTAAIYQRATGAPPSATIRKYQKDPEESDVSRAVSLANTKADDQTSLYELDDTPQNARARQCQIILPKCMQTT